MKALIKTFFHNAGFKLRQPTTRRMQLRLDLAQRLNEEVVGSAKDSGDSVTLNVRPDDLHGSSPLKEDMGPAAEGRPRVEQGIRLDDLLCELLSVARI